MNGKMIFGCVVTTFVAIMFATFTAYNPRERIQIATLADAEESLPNIDVASGSHLREDEVPTDDEVSTFGFRPMVRGEVACRSSRNADGSR